MKLIFMGTPQFACPTLENLVNNSDFEICAVYTKEPQIAGRGHKLQNSPIHDLALKHGLKIITPKTLRNQDAQQEFAKFNADAAVVVAYGLILPKEILSSTKLGCINIHPSLLPKWRGASPIQRPLMEGDEETGITIIKMDEGLDSGDMLYQERFSLAENETYKNLSEKLSQMGAKILPKVLYDLGKNKISPIKQDETLTTYAKKIDKAECEIDWNESAIKITRKIHGLSGSLGAYFTHKGEKIKIFAATIIDKDSTKNPAGKIIDDRLSIQCNPGVIRPDILQRQGKKVMTLEEFLLGFRNDA